MICPKCGGEAELHKAYPGHWVCKSCDKMFLDPDEIQKPPTNEELQRDFNWVEREGNTIKLGSLGHTQYISLEHAKKYVKLLQAMVERESDGHASIGNH